MVKKTKVNYHNYPFLIDYKNIRNAAWLFLLENKVEALPINLHELAANNQWLLLNYYRNQALADALDSAGVNSGKIGWVNIYGKSTVIFYKLIDNVGQMRFTIAHEFGHLALLHLTDLSTEDYEREANMFAARILMPMCVLKECGAFTAHEIIELCHVSITAATYRADRLKMLLKRDKFYSSPLERKLSKQFLKFIKQQKKIRS